MFSSTQSDKQSIIRYNGEFFNVRIEMGRLNDTRRHEAIGMIRGGPQIVKMQGRWVVHTRQYRNAFNGTMVHAP